MTTSKKKKKAPSKKKTTAKRGNGNGSSGGGSKDDRGGQRVPIQLLVDYKADGHYLFDFCRDLGAGGVFIQTKKPLAQGSSIDLTFTIPDSKETLTTKGTVIWVQGADAEDGTAGMGVQFEAFSGDQRKTLEDFVTRYHGDKYAEKVEEPRAG